MVVNGTVLINNSPLRGFSRQTTLFHIFALAGFSVWNVFPASLGLSISSRLSGPISSSSTQKPSRRTWGPAHPGNTFHRGKQICPESLSCKISQPGGWAQIQSLWPLLSPSWMPPELPCAPWAAVPCLLQAAVPTLSLSPRLRFPSGKK